MLCVLYVDVGTFLSFKSLIISKLNIMQVYVPKNVILFFDLF